mgnify:FL=1|tara:strand:- start:538 stop:954 length:417 start_codon:yes stop_codon:yes gene_type:complete
MKKKTKKKILVDMSASIIHNGHVRLIKKASKFGNVIIALTSDKEIKKYKNLIPELSWKLRKEILIEFKNVFKVIPSKFIITQNFLDKNKIDAIVQGSDYSKRKFKCRTITFNRTKNVSSTTMRKIAARNIKKTVGKRL